MPAAFHQDQATRQALAAFILEADQLSCGPQVAAFEQAFAAHQGRRHAVMVNSGSSANLALVQALMNLGTLKPGDTVGFSALGWATTVMPLLQLGLKPIPIDINPHTLNVSPDTILEAMGIAPIRCLFLTNLLGLCDDLVAIRVLCHHFGIVLLEDNCESLGSEAGGFKLGNLGVASTFSTYIGHHLSTIEGGLVCTDDVCLADELLMVRSHGWSRQLPPEQQAQLAAQFHVEPFHERFTFYSSAYNLRPTEIHGFLGLEALKTAREVYHQRADHFSQFQHAARSNPDIQAWDVKNMSLVSSFAYPLVFADQPTRLRYIKRFQGAGVEVRPIVGGCLPDQPFYRKVDRAAYKLPHARHADHCGFYVPNHPTLTHDEVDLLCTLIGERA